MTDHTHTENIGGDSIYFFGHPSRARNHYNYLATPLGTLRESGQYFVIYCLSLQFACLIYRLCLFRRYNAHFFVIYLRHLCIMFQ